MVVRARSPDVGRRFVAALESLDGGTAVVAVVGEVDLATAAALERTLLGAADDRTLRLVVDLTNCTFLDGRAISVLIVTRNRLERSRRSLALVVSSPRVLRIFQVTGLEGAFDIYPSRRAALEAGNGNGNGHG